MKLVNHILSAKFMAVLLFIMAAAIGVATFIENEYDTITAKELVYNAKWFELVLLLLMLNFINNIKTYQLLKWNKWSVLLLHFGFIIALLGSFVSRYFGYEGVMLIQENDNSSEIYSSEPYFQLKVHNDSIQYNEEQQHYFSKVNTSFPSSKIEFPGSSDIAIKVISRITNAQKEFIKDTPGGKLFLHLILPGRENLYLSSGEVVVKQGIPFAFNNNDREDAVKFFLSDNKLQIYAPFEMNKVDMASLSVKDRQSGNAIAQDTLAPNQLHLVEVRNLVSFLGLQVMISSIDHKAKLEYVSTDNEDLPDALITNIQVGDETHSEIIIGKSGIRAVPTTFKCGGLFFSLAYGAKNIQLPFEVGLTDFRLKKYPGSESPSSYESDIIIKDESNDYIQSYNLFMNHVVDYGGFRFFQSSYDWSNDQNKEAGLDPDITILSVNHDFWGTWITYLGYLLLAIGLLGTLFNPSSRFIEVRNKVIKMRNKRKKLLSIVIISLFINNLFGIDNYQPIPSAQADSMGVLLVQTYEGRIQPTHTLACDIFHKISKKTNFLTTKNEVLSPIQVLVDMMLDKTYWLDQKIIYIKKETEFQTHWEFLESMHL